MSILGLNEPFFYEAMTQSTPFSFTFTPKGITQDERQHVYVRVMFRWLFVYNKESIRGIKCGGWQGSFITGMIWIWKQYPGANHKK